jgi:urease accessory protein
VSRGLEGHLDLVCAPDARGVSVLRHQSFRAPMHISKPHHDADALVVNVVNPTAGLLEGDRVECRVRVESGARLLLTTPSASRAHRMREGSAELVQEMRIEAGGFLEFWPELFIPQGGTRYRQRTRLHVEDGGELIFFESLAPGRVAFGESFAFRQLTWETDVWHGVVHIARERYHLAPESESVRTLRAVFPDAYYASGFIVSPRLDDSHPCWQRLHDLHAPDAWIGCGRLAQGGWVIKCLAAGSVALRRMLATIRTELYAALDRPAPSLRRAGVA